MSVEPYVSTAQAARMLNVSLRTVQLWVEKGALKAWKTAGGHRRISLEGIRQVQRKQAQQAGALCERLKVLVVEGDENQRKRYRRHFRQWRLPVDLQLAEDGFRGLIKVGQFRPDLLITELDISGLDGFRMLEAIRQTDGFSDLAMVVVSKADCGVLKSKGLADSAVRTLIKPLSFAVVRQIVEERLSQRGIHSMESESKLP